MPRLTGFNSPLLLGFDHFERLLDQASKMSAEGYPPYNIEQTDENCLRITLAIAGFSIDDLSWDNTAAQHKASKDYRWPEHRRLMRHTGALYPEDSYCGELYEPESSRQAS